MGILGGAKERFLAALDGSIRPAYAARPELDAELARALGNARSERPGIEFSDEEFLIHLAGKLEAGVILDGLALGDLYLACACARGDTTALEIFERDPLLWLRGVLQRSGADDDTVSEVLQGLRRQLLAPRDGRPPGIALYSGRADLRSWLRVSAVRELARVEIRGRRELRLDTGELAALVAADDPETRHLKTKYRDEFKAAFADALAQLSDRQRRLLRYQVIERLSIDDIGALHRVHRATAARWMIEARNALAEATRARMAARLRIDRAEVQSVLRLVESEIDVSVERLLNAG